MDSSSVYVFSLCSSPFVWTLRRRRVIKKHNCLLGYLSWTFLELDNLVDLVFALNFQKTGRGHYFIKLDLGEEFDLHVHVFDRL